MNHQQKDNAKKLRTIMCSELFDSVVETALKKKVSIIKVGVTK